MNREFKRIEIFHNIYVFTVTTDQFNEFLLSKSIKILVTLNLWMVMSVVEITFSPFHMY